MSVPETLSSKRALVISNVALAVPNSATTAPPPSPVPGSDALLSENWLPSIDTTVRLA